MNAEMTMKQKVGVGVVATMMAAGVIGHAIQQQCARPINNAFIEQQTLVERRIIDERQMKNPKMKPYFELKEATAKLAEIEQKFKSGAEANPQEKVRLAVEAEATAKKIDALESMRIDDARVSNIKQAIERTAKEAAALREQEAHLTVRIEKSQDIKEVVELQRELQQVRDKIGGVENASPIEKIKAEVGALVLAALTLVGAIGLFGALAGFLSHLGHDLGWNEKTEKNQG